MEPAPLDVPASEDDEFYIVERILDVDIKNNLIKYKVRWEGYMSDDDTWEPEDNFNSGEHVEQMLRKFKSRNCERIQKLKETLANRENNRRQNWYYESHVDDDQTAPKTNITEKDTFFDEEVSQITGEKKKLLDMTHKYTETELFLSDIASRDRITRTRMKELRGSDMTTNTPNSASQFHESSTKAKKANREIVIKKETAPRTPGRAKKEGIPCTPGRSKESASQTPARVKKEIITRTPGRPMKETAAYTSGRVEKDALPCTPGRSKKITALCTPARVKKVAIECAPDWITREITPCTPGRKRKSYWEYVSETDENENTIERELDDNDLFFGEKVSEITGEKKKLVDKTHKMSSTEMILSQINTTQRITRNQMKTLCGSSDTSSGVASPTTAMVKKPSKRRSSTKKLCSPEVNLQKSIAPEVPVSPIADYIDEIDHDDFPELKKFPIITTWAEHQIKREIQSIRPLTGLTPQEFLRACKEMDAQKVKAVYIAVPENEFANYCNLRFPDDCKNILHFIAAEANCEERNHIADEMAYIICRSTVKEQLLRQTDNYGNTPLHYAAMNGLTCLARIFIENGSPINAEDRNGETPLCLAYKLNHKNLLMLLLRYGASCHQIRNDLQVNSCTGALQTHVNNIGRLLKDARENSLVSITEIMTLSPVFIKPISEGPEFYFKFQNSHFSFSENNRLILLAVYLCQLDDDQREWKVNCYPRLKMQTLPLVNRRIVHDAGVGTPMIYPCSLDPGNNDILIRLTPESIIAHKYILACQIFLGVIDQV